MSVAISMLLRLFRLKLLNLKGCDIKLMLLELHIYFYCLIYPYLILTNAYMLVGPNMDDQTRISLKEIFFVSNTAYMMSAHVPIPRKPRFASLQF